MKSDIHEHDIWNYMKIVNQLKPYTVGHKGFVAGGVFKNLFNGEKFKDIDIFFNSKEDFMDALSMFEKDDNFYKLYENKKVNAFKDKHTGVVVELIKHKFGSPLEIIDDFDFTITKVAYVNNYKTQEQIEQMIDDGEIQPDDDIRDVLQPSQFLIHKDFFEHLHTHRLVVDDKMVMPYNTFERMFRYAKYGYFPCRETKKKIILAIRNDDKFSDELLSKSLYDGMYWGGHMDEILKQLQSLDTSKLSEEELAELHECLVRISQIIKNLNDMQKWLDKFNLK